MSEINKGFYKNFNSGIYVTEEQFIWEYKWFYHDESDDVYFIAKELRTGTTISKPLETKDDLQPEIEDLLEESTSYLKTYSK